GRCERGGARAAPRRGGRDRPPRAEPAPLRRRRLSPAPARRRGRSARRAPDARGLPDDAPHRCPHAPRGARHRPRRPRGAGARPPRDPSAAPPPPPAPVPVRPPLSGADGPRVFALRSPADLDALRAALDAGARRAVVVGGGSAGLRTAEALVRRGVEVELAEM